MMVWDSSSNIYRSDEEIQRGIIKNHSCLVSASRSQTVHNSILIIVFTIRIYSLSSSRTDTLCYLKQVVIRDLVHGLLRDSRYVGIHLRQESTPLVI